MSTTQQKSLADISALLKQARMASQFQKNNEQDSISTEDGEITTASEEISDELRFFLFHSSANKMASFMYISNNLIDIISVSLLYCMSR